MSTSRRHFMLATTSLAMMTVIAPLRAANPRAKQGAPASANPDLVLIASQSLMDSPWVQQCSATVKQACGEADSNACHASAWLNQPQLITETLQVMAGKRLLLLLDPRDEVVLHMGLRQLEASVHWESQHVPGHDPRELGQWMMHVASGTTDARQRALALARYDTSVRSPLDPHVVSLVVQL
jgi:hypothetical protein